MELQKNQNSIKVELVGCELFKLNLLVNYPYSDELIEFMAKTLIDMMPSLNIDTLKELMDKYLRGVRKYNKENGITQIYKDLTALELHHANIDNKW